MDQQIRFCRDPDGVTLAWATSGRGPALVKAANWLSHLEHDWRSAVWQPLLERLGSRHTVVRYDERGCGLSDRDVEDIGLESWVRDLETVVDAAGLDRFPLLGISQGGPIAIAYCVRHPERVSRLVLYGTYARGRLRRDPTPAQIEEAEMLVRLVELGWGKDVDAYRRVFASLFWPEASPRQMKAFTELQRLSASPETAARIVAAFDQVDVTDLAPSVSVPTLVLHVEGDARIPFEEGRVAASLIPGAEFVPLPGVNHVVAPGDPAFELFFDAVEGFLSQDLAAMTLPDVAGLTPREREVLELLARGLDNTSLAEALSISAKTVRNHVSSIFAKLDVAHRAAAVVRARELGFGREGPR
jgi:pimeloyl-ACP methyl ester carboxylesterase/DNA-binding CsgD family transcriptional regulator